MNYQNVMHIVNDRMIYIGGQFVYIKKSYKSLFMRKVGKLQKNGYKYIQIKNKRYLEHRLIFLLFHGYLPKEVDHINRIATDNRIENLRACTSKQNAINKSILPCNTSGVTGVGWCKQQSQWRAKIKAEGKTKCLGRYDDFEDAVKARKQAELIYFDNEFLPA